MSPVLRHRLPSRSLLLSLAMGTALPALVVATPAVAQAAPTARYDIAAGPLATVLNRFARRAGLDIIYDARLTRGMRSAGLKGDLPAAEALSHLLAGTGLTFRFTGANGVQIERIPETADGTVRLGTLRVEAPAAASSGSPGGRGGDGGPAGADIMARYRAAGTDAVISREKIDRVPPASTGDIFRETPGVLSGSNHNGSQIDLNIRGLQGNDRVKVLVDGTQQSSGVYRGYAGPDNRSYVDADLIGGVDVAKGPGTGVNAGGALGGLVNIRTLEPQDILLEGRRFGVRLRGGLGDNRIAPRFNPAVIQYGSGGLRSGRRSFGGANWSGNVAAAYSDDRFEVLGAYAHREQGNHVAGRKYDSLTYLYREWNGIGYDDMVGRYSPFAPGSKIPNSSENTESILLKAKVKWDDGLSVELGLVDYSSKFGLVFPSWLGGIPQQFGLSSVDSRRIYSRLRWNPEDNDLVRLSAGLWHTGLDSVDSTQAVGVAMFRNDVETWGGDIVNRSLIVTPVGDLELRYGGEYSRSDSTRMLAGEDAPVLGTEGRRTLGGLFVQARLNPLSWLQVDAGLRHDWYSARGTSPTYVYVYDPEFAMNIVRREGALSASAFSPSATITVTPVDGIQLFARYTRGWRPPSLGETAGPNEGVTPNPLLRPERSNSYEAGANLFLKGLVRGDDQLGVKLAWFRNDYSDYIIRGQFRPQGETGLVTGYINSQGARLAGVEASFDYVSGPFFASAHVTRYTKVEYCFTPWSWYSAPEQGFEPGAKCHEQVPIFDWVGTVPPKYSGSATIGARLFERRLTIGARTNFFGTRALPIPTYNYTNFPRVWPRTQTYDLFAGYMFSDHMRLDASVENLTDRYYVSPLAQATIASPGRIARLTATLRF